jgi:hypothetical protein
MADRPTGRPGAGGPAPGEGSEVQAQCGARPWTHWAAGPPHPLRQDGPAAHRGPSSGSGPRPSSSPRLIPRAAAHDGSTREGDGRTSPRPVVARPSARARSLPTRRPATPSHCTAIRRSSWSFHESRRRGGRVPAPSAGAATSGAGSSVGSPRFVASAAGSSGRRTRRPRKQTPRPHCTSTASSGRPSTRVRRAPEPILSHRGGFLENRTPCAWLGCNGRQSHLRGRPALDRRRERPTGVGWRAVATTSPPPDRREWAPRRGASARRRGPNACPGSGPTGRRPVRLQGGERGRRPVPWMRRQVQLCRHEGAAAHHTRAIGREPCPGATCRLVDDGRSQARADARGVHLLRYVEFGPPRHKAMSPPHGRWLVVPG